MKFTLLSYSQIGLGEIGDEKETTGDAVDA